jgi:putative transposase
MVVRINGKRMFLWRAVDDEGEVLDALVQKRRNARAAKRLLRKLLKKQGYLPDRFVTDGCSSYGPAFEPFGCRARCPASALMEQLEGFA